MNATDLEARIDAGHEEEQRLLAALGRAVLAGLPAHSHRRRLAELRLDLEALHSADRIQRRRVTRGHRQFCG